VSVWLGWPVFEGAWSVGVEVRRLVEAAFGALGDEGGRGRRGVGEDSGERKVGRHRAMMGRIAARNAILGCLDVQI